MYSEHRFNVFCFCNWLFRFRCTTKNLLNLLHTRINCPAPAGSLHQAPFSDRIPQHLYNIAITTRNFNGQQVIFQPKAELKCIST